jgi:hypothetical protein
VAFLSAGGGKQGSWEKQEFAISQAGLERNEISRRSVLQEFREISQLLGMDSIPQAGHGVVHRIILHFIVDRIVGWV